MVPREILNYTPSRRGTHLFNDFRMSIHMLKRSCDCVHISRFHNDSVDPITHDIACLASGNLRQGAGGCVVGDLGAPLQLRRKNVHRALVEISLRVSHKPYNANVIAPELLQIRLRFFMHEPDQPQLGISQIQPVPRLQHMLNAFASYQSACKNSAKFLWSLPRSETFDIYPSRQVIEFFLRESADAKGMGCLFRQHQQEISKVVLLYETPPLEQEPVFPPLNARSVSRWRGRFRSPDFLFAAVAMPGWNFDNRRNAALFCRFQRTQTVTRP